MVQNLMSCYRIRDLMMVQYGLVVLAKPVLVPSVMPMELL